MINLKILMVKYVFPPRRELLLDELPATERKRLAKAMSINRRK
jgi:hypothetical protein